MQDGKGELLTFTVHDDSSQFRPIYRLDQVKTLMTGADCLVVTFDGSGVREGALLKMQYIIPG